MDQLTRRYVQTLWDYMHMDMPLEASDLIVGFGCYNEDIALRAAQLYHGGYAKQILFTGGLGRNTKQMWTEPEADRFARIAIEAGVPPQDILIENQSTNTAENILFTRKMLADRPIRRIIGIHKPFMERRLFAAMGVYWPEMDCIVTSPQVSIEEYIRLSEAQGLDDKRVIEVLVGDFQRIDAYAKRGYQIPQHIPEPVWHAFDALVSMGYTHDLVE